MNAPNSAPIDWRRLFPDNDFRFPMNMRQGNAKAFFSATKSYPDLALYHERCRWFESEDWDNVSKYAVAEPDALELVSQFVRTFHVEGDILLPATDAERLCAAAGMALEPDWMLMRPDANGVYRLAAGAVCFPSGWALREKLGLPVEDVHAIVPGLNVALGRQIQAFLEKLAPETGFERDNWGLSADCELNHHPSLVSLGWKRMDSSATLDTTWIRLERQAFYKMPRSGAIAFGISVSNHRLSDVCAVPGIAVRIARALQTIPCEVAVYKGFEAARTTLIEQLNARALG